MWKEGFEVGVIVGGQDYVSKVVFIFIFKNGVIWCEGFQFRDYFDFIGFDSGYCVDINDWCFVCFL